MSRDFAEKLAVTIIASALLAGTTGLVRLALKVERLEAQLAAAEKRADYFHGDAGKDR